MTLTARALAILREEGYEAQVVEKWIPQARRRVDLFGCLDIVCAGHGRIIGVQVTSASNFASRRSKVLASRGAWEWMMAGGIVEVWGFRKKNGRWIEPRREQLSPGTQAPDSVSRPSAE